MLSFAVWQISMLFSYWFSSNYWSFICCFTLPWHHERGYVSILATSKPPVKMKMAWEDLLKLHVLFRMNEKGHRETCFWQIQERNFSFWVCGDSNIFSSAEKMVEAGLMFREDEEAFISDVSTASTSTPSISPLFLLHISCGELLKTKDLFLISF